MIRDDDAYAEDPPNPREYVEDPIVVAERVSRADKVFHAALVDAMSEHEPTCARGLLRMSALTFEAGEGAPRFLALPSYLPGDEPGQRLLMSSQAATDASLKADLLDWAHTNRRIGEPAAKTLENAVIGHRRGRRVLDATHAATAKVEPARQALADAYAAVEALEGAETWDEDAIGKAVATAQAAEAYVEVAIKASTIDPVLVDAMSTVAGWLSSVWGVRPEDAPDDTAALAAWAEALVAKANPTPDWIIPGTPSRRAFVPSARHMGPRSAKAVIG